jgi:hypothetical protein
MPGKKDTLLVPWMVVRLRIQKQVYVGRHPHLQFETRRHLVFCKYSSLGKKKVVSLSFHGKIFKFLLTVYLFMDGVMYAVQVARKSLTPSDPSDQITNVSPT